MSTDDYTSDISLKRCSSGDNCLHPDGPLLPNTHEYFYRNRRSKDGLATRCRICTKASAMQSYQANPQRTVERVRQSRLANPDARKVYDAAYREKHPDRLKQSQQDYAEHHPERAKTLARKRSYKYRATHPEKRSEWDKNYHRTHMGQARIHRKQRRMRERTNGGVCTAAELKALYHEQECRCAYCGIALYWDIPGDIHVDHIRPVSRGGSSNILNAALACVDCNKGKSNSTYEEWAVRRGW